jgi:hypothetical protein
MSKPRMEWNGFEPTGYEVNWSVLMEAPLTEVTSEGAKVQTTAGAVLREATPHRFPPLNADGSIGETAPRQPCEVKEGPGFATMTTPRRTITLHTLGDSTGFAAHLLTTVIEIDRLVGDHPFHPVFFYYDRDHVTDDAHESFFVVNENRFLLDRVSLSRYSGNGFDPHVFRLAFGVDPQTWDSEPDVAAARVRWWYRRFYEETDAGQVTTLREDADRDHDQDHQHVDQQMLKVGASAGDVVDVRSDQRTLFPFRDVVVEVCHHEREAQAGRSARPAQRGDRRVCAGDEGGKGEDHHDARPAAHDGDAHAGRWRAAQDGGAGTARSCQSADDARLLRARARSAASGRRATARQPAASVMNSRSWIAVGPARIRLHERGRPVMSARGFAKQSARASTRPNAPAPVC